VIKRFLKPFFKKNKLWFSLLTFVIYFYLKVVYLTSKWQFIWPKDDNGDEINNFKGSMFAMWHNRLAFGPGIFFRNTSDTAALISPHSDGKFISQVVKLFGFDVIEGSSNKNPVSALKKIIQKLSQDDNVVITPDGPRGPIYQINSSITNIARKYNYPLYPVTCSCTRYFLLKTWDKLIIPLPFSKIIVMIGERMIITEDSLKNDKCLEQALNQLTTKSDEMVKKL
jgi:lysophospholipid acyltransferase (LPLAT)-like uncharacterized protein